MLPLKHALLLCFDFQYPLETAHCKLLPLNLKPDLKSCIWIYERAWYIQTKKCWSIFILMNTVIKQFGQVMAQEECHLSPHKHCSDWDQCWIWENANAEYESESLTQTDEQRRRWERRGKRERRSTSSSRRALSHSFCPGACWVHMLISWLMLSVTALSRERERERERH